MTNLDEELKWAREAERVAIKNMLEAEDAYFRSSALLEKAMDATRTIEQRLAAQKKEGG